MKERIVTNIRKSDPLTCTANGQRTPLPPMALAAAHLGKIIPEPPTALVEPSPAPSPPVATAPTPEQNPPPPPT